MPPWRRPRARWIGGHVKPRQAAPRASLLSYVERVSSRDLEPRPPSSLVEKIDNALAVLIIVGIVGGSFWLAGGLTSSYLYLFN